MTQSSMSAGHTRTPARDTCSQRLCKHVHAPSTPNIIVDTKLSASASSHSSSTLWAGYTMTRSGPYGTWRPDKSLATTRAVAGKPEGGTCVTTSAIALGGPGSLRLNVPCVRRLQVCASACLQLPPGVSPMMAVTSHNPVVRGGQHAGNGHFMTQRLGQDST